MIANVLNLARWEWFKLRRRWMPWILLAVAVVFVQIGVWVAYAAYHNETLQEIASGGTSSFGVTSEVDGETVSVDVSCVELVEGRMPPGIDRRRFPRTSGRLSWKIWNGSATNPAAM